MASSAAVPFSAHGGRLTITVQDGYLKAYARPLNEAGEEVGIVSYGLQGRLREQVREGVEQLVAEFFEAAGQQGGEDG